MPLNKETETKVKVGGIKDIRGIYTFAGVLHLKASRM